MKKLIILMALFAILLHSCTPSIETPTTTDAPALQRQDFDVDYHGIKLSDSADLTVLAEQLEFDLNGWYENRQYAMAGTCGLPDDKNEYVFYWAKYPNEKDAEIEFRFWYNQTSDELLVLTGIRLLSKKIKTNRGISIGDDEITLKAAYGNDIKLWDLGDTVFYDYESDIGMEKECNMSFYLDPNSRTIENIDINYHVAEVLENLGIGIVD